MGGSWVPLSDNGLEAFVAGFSAKVSLDPAAYGLSVSDAASLAGLRASFVNALAISSDPATRTRTAVTNKNGARAAMLRQLRVLAGRVQANPAVTPGQRTDLGLKVRGAGSAIPPPRGTPTLGLAQMYIGSHTVRIADAEVVTRRGRPPGVRGAEIFCHVGDGPPPPDLADWRFEGQTTERQFRITCGPEDNGKPATIVARWFNPKGEPGPLSSPLRVPIAA
jgi:hypothetical protein